MARTSRSQHAHQTLLANNPAVDISANQWNDVSGTPAHIETGMFGTPASVTYVQLSSQALTPVDTHTVVAAQTSPGSGTDSIYNITNTNTNAKDWLFLIPNSGDTITVYHNQGGTGNIFLLGAYNKQLVAGVAMALFRVGTNWYEAWNYNGVIQNANVATSAGIVYSKLNLSNSIVNSDISNSAAINPSKISGTAAILGANTFTGLQIFEGGAEVTDTTDTTKVLTWLLSSMTTGKTLTIKPLLTTSQTLQIPNITGTDTLMTLGLAQTVTGALTLSALLTMSGANIALGSNEITTTDYAIAESASSIVIVTTGNSELQIKGLTPQLGLIDTTASQTTPNKYLQCSGGIFSINNSADNAYLFRLSDTGLVYFYNTVTLFNNIATAGYGVPAIFGIDNRTGRTAADGSAITLYSVPSTTGLFQVIIDIFATAYTSGTATYTITWTENSGTRTLAVTATVLNTLGTAQALIRPDASTNITVQLTGTFTATVNVGAVVKQVA